MDKTIYEYVVLDLDTPTKNQNIYPKNIIEREIKKYKEEFVDKNKAYVRFIPSNYINNEIAIIKDIRIGIHNQLLVKIQLLDTDFSKKIVFEQDKFNFQNYEIIIVGSCRLTDNKIQDDYKLIEFVMKVK
jgi:hypothetical protein